MKIDKLPKIGQCDGGWRRVGILRVDIEEGFRSPNWYGLAWWDYQSRWAICYPIPINWVMWLLREIYWKLKSTPMHYNHPMWKEGYAIGRRDARLLRDCGDKDG